MVTIGFLSAAIHLIFWAILGYFLLINTIYLSLLIVSFVSTKQANKSREAYEITGLFDSELYKTVSILLPVFNEQENVRETVYSLLQLNFHEYEIIVINDGSTDRTFDILQKEFGLFPSERFIPQILPHNEIKGVYVSKMYPNMVVLDKENGKKADALNAGVNAARKEVVCSVDADSWLERDVLRHMLRAFVEDEKTIAVGGIIRVSNGCIFDRGQLKEIRPPDSFQGRLQVIEYMRSFLFGRIGWSSVDGLIIISGAFAVFDRSSLIKAGGYKRESIGEDVEIVVNMHQYFMENNIPYRMKYMPESVCWTRVPETWNELSAQRNRWQRGLADTLFNHKSMIGKPKYGWLGMFSMPFHLVFELFGPVIEFGSYLFIFILLISGLLDPQFALLFIVIVILYGMLLSVGSLLLDEMTYRPYSRLKDIYTLTFYAFLENLGYRQLHTWWRFRGLYDYFRNRKEWEIRNRNPELTNMLHWVWLIAINIFFSVLLFVGITGI